ncbi:hypothetical protein E1218_04655 [Kribbella turkmenica]|uniref:Uncharacterized protein n=1 Tax=Kribbella turkmenica TaxID=2530375 RepID=A0A4R4XF64_9ACTN|nr:hypothetical protein [Kribbella turkmenica]TDD29324.1 hypothetical protein E1218_04655 [Kribbella turkmenica]
MSDGEAVAPALVERVLTVGELVYADGATQVFDTNGGTTYVENGRPTQWHTDGDGQFGSFWPPSHRNTYDLRWSRTASSSGSASPSARTRFDGRYRH